jgi:UPF0755 protein
MDPGAPRRGRHAQPDESWDAGSPSWGAGSSFWSEEAPEGQAAPTRDVAAPTRDMEAWEGSAVGDRGPSSAERAYGTGRWPSDGVEWEPAGGGRTSRVLERWPDETGPLPEARHRTGGGEPGEDGPRPDDDASRYGRDRGGSRGEPGEGSRHPSGPLPPLPRSAWSKLERRRGGSEDDETAAAEPLPPSMGGDRRWSADDVETEGQHLDDDWDRTGGLEVIGAYVEEESRRGLFRRRGHRPAPAPLEDIDLHDDVLDVDHDGEDTPGHGAPHDEDIPIAPYDPKPHRRRKWRKRVGLLVCLVLLAGVVGGVVLGGQKLWGLVVPQDYTGQGTGSAQIRIKEGETLTEIGQSMVDAGVIASVRPFTSAANANPQATSIAPGIYGLHKHMSGKNALDLLLKPSSRLVSRVTFPEGLTVTQTLQRLAQGTGVPAEQVQAAAADTASLGLPPYANGTLEGFLFPATYDFEPGTTPTQMLKAMVAHTVSTLDQLQIPAEQRLAVLTKASIVQAEAGSIADMPKFARVLNNRLAQGMLLQLDTTVNYATGKTGLTTSDQDRASPSPYNTYVHPGLPPGPIGDPGEEALRAVLSPASGDWLFFVVVNPDTGETRFAVTADEHEKNVALFQAWLRAHPGG